MQAFLLRKISTISHFQAGVYSIAIGGLLTLFLCWALGFMGVPRSFAVGMLLVALIGESIFSICKKREERYWVTPSRELFSFVFAFSALWLVAGYEYSHGIFPWYIAVVPFGVFSLRILTSADKGQIKDFVLRNALYLFLPGAFILLLHTWSAQRYDIIIPFSILYLGLALFPFLGEPRDSFSSRGTNLTNWQWIVAAFVFALAFFVRWINIDNLVPYVDSFFHIIAVMDLRESGTLTYTRSLLYTFIEYIFSYPDVYNIGLLRLPNILISMGTIGVMFLFSRRIFKSTGIAFLASVIYSLSYWSIATSRMIRMYPMQQFFFLLFLFCFYCAITPGNKESRWVVAGVHTVHGMTALVAFLLASHFHVLTLSVVPILALIVFIKAAIPIVRHRRSRVIPLGPIVWLTIVGICLASLILIYGRGLNLFSGFRDFLSPHQVDLSSAYNYAHWFLVAQVNSTLLVVSFGFFVASAIRRKDFGPWFLLIIFVFLWTLATYVFDRYFSPRYAYFIQPLFILIISAGLWSFVEWAARIVFRKRETPLISFLVALLVVLVWFTPLDVAYGVSHWSHGENAIFEIHLDYKTQLSRIPMKKSDGVIELVEGPARYYLAWPDVLSLNAFEHTERAQVFFEYVLRHETGWYLPDRFRHETWSCDVMVPCFLRNVVNKYFFQHRVYDLENLLTMSWKTLIPNEVGATEEGMQAYKYSDEVFLFNTEWRPEEGAVKGRVEMKVQEREDGQFFILFTKDDHGVIKDAIFVPFQSGRGDFVLSGDLLEVVLVDISKELEIPLQLLILGQSVKIVE